MAVSIPPVPYKTTLTNDQGFLSEPWVKWFRDLFLRIGGLSAPSNSELSTLVGDAALATTVATLSTTSASHTTSIAILNGLGQGPTL